MSETKRERERYKGRKKERQIDREGVRNIMVFREDYFKNHGEIQTEKRQREGESNTVKKEREIKTMTEREKPIKYG